MAHWNRASAEISQQAETLYVSGKSLREVGDTLGLTPSGVWQILRRRGVHTRTSQEVGPVHGAKRSGDNHWTKKRGPLPLKPKQYRSMRIIDEDGLSHKRRFHVILMERHIGRRLRPDECVHHINGDRHDNRFENLQLMTKSEHARYEATLAHQRFPEKYRVPRCPRTGRLLPRGATA